LNLYVQKPCEAIQLNNKNIQKIIGLFPEEKFVFFGIQIIDGKEQKIFEDDLSDFQKVGGFLYHNHEVKTIYDGEWIIKRKDEYEFMSDEYFTLNFIQIPFIEINNQIIKKDEEDVNT
jgi:hypothetical protein